MSSTSEAQEFIDSVKKDDAFPKTYIPLMMKTRNSVLVAWEDTFRGSTNFNVREFYLDQGDTLRFGKNGLSVSATKKHELLSAFKVLLDVAGNHPKGTSGEIDMSKVNPVG